MFEINSLEFVRNEFLIHTVDFGIGPAFSKVHVFSEGPGPGPGPNLLYKVCQ